MNGRTILAGTGLALLLMLGCAVPAVAEGGGRSDPQAAEPEPAQWLRDHPAAMTALDRLSPGARRRFLRNLVVRDGVIVSFSHSELSAELDTAGSAAFLSAFGLEEYARAEHGHGGEPAALRRIAAAPRVPSELEGRYDAFVDVAAEQPRGESDKARSERVGAAFARLFPEAQSADAIAVLGDHDLWLLFRAANYTADTSPTATHARILQRVFDTLHARSLATRAEHVDMQRRLLAARLHGDARAFTTAHPEAGLAVVPQVLDDAGPASTGPTLLRQVGTDWRRERVDLDRAQVFVLSGCHFANDAARDIAADPILGPAFAKHARWLSLPPGNGDFAEVSEWNHSHAPQRMEMVYDRDEWTLFDRWLVPTFIVLRDGREIDRLSGWSADESEARRARLAAALHRAGLLDAPSDADADADAR